MIDVNPNHLETVTRILAGHVPECEVRAFGSRVTWTAKDYSDLDLAVVGARTLDPDALRRLKEAFEDSDLPFRVDVLDWHAISSAFRKVIEKKYEVVQQGKQKSLGMAGDALAGDRARGWLYQPDFPDHWRHQPLYSLAQWVNGLAFRDIQFTPTGKPVIKIAEIKDGISGQTKFTSQTFDPSVHVSNGDLLFSWSGQPETSIDAFWWRGPDGWLNQHVFIVAPRPEVDRTFFYYLLRYLKPNFVGIARNKQTTGLGHVTKRDLENIDVAYPSRPEQRAIAHILGTLDDKIELNRRMNETLEAMARALFKSWFVDFDPVRAKHALSNVEGAEGRDPGLPRSLAALFPDRFEDSELGEIPAGWEVKKLSDLCSTQYGYTASGVDKPIGPKFLRVTDINKRNWIEWGDVPHCAIEPAARASYALQVGDLVVARMADPGKAAIIEEEIDAVFASYLVRLKTPSLAHSYYVYGFLKSDFYAEYAEGAKSGSVQSNMNAKVIVGVSLVVPTNATMEQFLRALLPLRQRLIANVSESRTLAALRDTLLPKLISGELRVPEAERIVAETA